MNKELLINNRIITEDPLKILSDIRFECHNGKLSNFKISGTGISVPCPHHNNGLEKNNSCYLNLKNENIDYLYCHCFTCGFACDFSTFVGACFDKSKEWGENWLLSRYAKDYVKSNLVLDKIDISKNYIKEDYLDESILDSFESYHPYMTRRKLTDDVIKRFKIKYDPATKSLVFPVYDKNNKLKFLTRRSVEGKQFIIDKSASKKDIYCLNEVLNDNIKEVVVVESQINCLTL